MKKLKPELKSKIWGGNKLEAYFESDLSNIGEAWIASGIEGNSSKIIVDSNEEYLSKFYKENKEQFGVDDNEFPILIKIIDAKKDLSIQVHPDDIKAKKINKNYNGKQECWYILETDNKDIVMGTEAKNIEEVKGFIDQKEWFKLAKIQKIKNDDFISIEPGVIHAIKGGTMLYELQQPSDTTFRIYDYDRLENGKPRELHLKESIECIDFINPKIESSSNSKEFINNKYFKLNFYNDRKNTLSSDKFFVITNIANKNMKVNDIKLKRYESVLVLKEDNFKAEIKKGKKYLVASN